MFASGLHRLSVTSCSQEKIAIVALLIGFGARDFLTRLQHLPVSVRWLPEHESEKARIPFTRNEKISFGPAVYEREEMIRLVNRIILGCAEKDGSLSKKHQEVSKTSVHMRHMVLVE
jgi:hypothetical protein